MTLSWKTTGKCRFAVESVTLINVDVPFVVPVPPLAVDKVPAPASSILNSPENFVAVNNPELELNLKFVPVFGARFPVASVVNTGKHVVSVDSSATVISDAAALAVT